MPENQNPEASNVDSTQGETTPPEGGSNSAEGVEAGNDQPTPKPEDDLPEWARNKLSEAYSDAAKYRVRAREAEEKLGQAKTVEEFEAAVKEFKESNAALELDLSRERAIANHKLSGDDADLVRTLTGDAIEQVAARLAAAAAQKNPDPYSKRMPPQGGSTGVGESDEVVDGREAYRKFKERNRR